MKITKKNAAVVLNLVFPGFGQFYLKRWIMGILFVLSSAACFAWLLFEMYCVIILNLKNMLYSLDDSTFTFQFYTINTLKFATALIMLIFLVLLSIFDAVFIFKEDKKGKKEDS